MSEPDVTVTPKAPPDVSKAILFLLIRIGGWTNARFDQHLRHEFGDTVADETMKWLEENVSPELGKFMGEPLYLCHQ